MKLDKFFERARRGICRANISDIELAQTRPQARQQVLNTYTALRRLMKHCGIEPQEAVKG